MTRSLLATAAAAAVLLSTSAAFAAEAGDAGWWTRAGAPPEASSAPLPVPAPSPAPDATEDSLVVQGGPRPEDPVSFAAVSFSLDEGETASRLKLTVAEGSASAPQAKLMVCPITGGSFDAADGGPMADAPKYDCATKAEAAPAEGSYSFDVSAIKAEGTLAVAVLAVGPTDRVVLAKPTSESLESSGGSSGDSSFDDGTSGSDSFGSDSSFGGGGSTGSAFSDSGGGSSFSSGSFDAPSIPTDMGSAGTGSGAAAGAGRQGSSAVALQAAPAARGEDGGGSLAPLLVTLLALVGGGLWLAAGRISAGAGPVAAR